MITWLLRHAITMWALFLLTTIAIGLAARAVWPDIKPGPAGVSAVQVLLVTILALLTVPFARALGRSAVGFVRPRRGTLVLLAFPVLTVLFGYLAGLKSISDDQIALAVVLVVLVAIGEEVAFRGVLLWALAPRGLWASVITSSALFGLMHLANLALGASLTGTALQILFAGMGGIGFAAMRLRTGSLWPGIALHAAYDLTFRVTHLEPGTMFANAVFMLHGVGWLLWAVVVLRGSQRRGGDPALTSNPVATPDLPDVAVVR